MADWGGEQFMAGFAEGVASVEGLVVAAMVDVREFMAALDRVNAVLRQVPVVMRRLTERLLWRPKARLVSVRHCGLDTWPTMRSGSCGACGARVEFEELQHRYAGIL